MNRVLDATGPAVDHPGQALPATDAPSLALPPDFAATTHEPQAPLGMREPDSALLAEFGPDPDIGREPEPVRAPLKNIERFNQVTGEVLAALYEEFPMTAKITAADLSRKLENGTTPNFVTGTVNWLEKEGYLRIESMMGQNYSIHDTPIMDAVLTSKGLAILQTTPEALKEKGGTLGAQISEAAKKGWKDGASKLVEKALSVGVSTLVRAAVDHGRTLLP